MIIIQSLYSYTTIIHWSSGGHQMVIRWSSDGHQTVIRQSSDGHQTVIRWSSEGHQKVIRQSPDSHQTESSVNYFLFMFQIKRLFSFAFCINLFPLIWIQNLKPQFWKKSCVQIPSVHLQRVHFIRIYTIAAAHNCLELHSQ